MKSKKVTLTLAAITGAAAFMAQLGGSKVNAEENRAAHYMFQNNGDSWDGNHYYLEDGTMVYNAFFCDGRDTYYLQADGTPMKDRLTYHPDGIHIIYFDANGHEVFSDFSHISKSIAGADVDDMCFFDMNGYMYVDTLTYDMTGTKLYYVNQYGVLERNGWFQFSGYEFDAGLGFSGQAGGYGYANADCSLMVNTNTYDWNGNLVYMQGDGHMEGSQTGKPDGDAGPSGEGWYRLGGNIYYFLPDSKEAAKGLTKIDGKYYYFDTETGAMLRNTYVNNVSLDENGRCIITNKVMTWVKNDATGEFEMLDYVPSGRIYEQDEFGRTTCIWLYNNGSEIERTYMLYDAQGNMTLLKTIRWDGISAWSEYEYDEEGNKIKTNYKDADGNVYMTEEYEYVIDSGVTRAICTYKNSGGIMLIREWDYDNKNRLIKNFDTETNGNIKYIEENEYYDDGGCYQKKYNSEGNLKVEYKYNSKGEKILERSSTYYKELIYENEKIVKVMKGRNTSYYTYNSRGDIESIIEYDEYGDVYGWDKYEYDENGNLIFRDNKESEYTHRKWWYKYDEYNNCIEEIWDTAGGEGVLHCQKTVYEYDKDKLLREAIYYGIGDRYITNDNIYDCRYSFMDVKSWDISSEIYYDGNKTKKIKYENNEIANCSEYVYNEKGKVLKETSYDGEGNILEQTEYAYNIYGYVSWCKDVTGEKRYEYTYRYQ